MDGAFYSMDQKNSFGDKVIPCQLSLIFNEHAQVVFAMVGCAFRNSANRGATLVQHLQKGAQLTLWEQSASAVEYSSLLSDGLCILHISISDFGSPSRKQWLQF